jgi:hypothetical protein
MLATRTVALVGPTPIKLAARSAPASLRVWQAMRSSHLAICTSIASHCRCARCTASRATGGSSLLASSIASTSTFRSASQVTGPALVLQVALPAGLRIQPLHHRAHVGEVAGVTAGVELAAGFKARAAAVVSGVSCIVGVGRRVPASDETQH